MRDLLRLTFPIFQSMVGSIGQGVTSVFRSLLKNGQRTVKFVVG